MVRRSLSVALKYTWYVNRDRGFKYRLLGAWVMSFPTAVPRLLQVAAGIAGTISI